MLTSACDVYVQKCFQLFFTQPGILSLGPKVDSITSVITSEAVYLMQLSARQVYSIITKSPFKI